MIGLLVEIGTVGIYKILCTGDVDTLQGGDRVGILEAAVKDGDSHPLSLHPDVVESLPEQHLDLFLPAAVVCPWHAVPGVKAVVGFLAHHSRDTVWRRPDMCRLAHTVQGGQPLEQGSVVGPHQHGVVPARGPDDGPLQRTLLQVANKFSGSLLDLLQIAVTYGQVGGV